MKVELEAYNVRAKQQNTAYQDVMLKHGSTVREMFIERTRSHHMANVKATIERQVYQIHSEINVFKAFRGKLTDLYHKYDKLSDEPPTVHPSNVPQISQSELLMMLDSSDKVMELGTLSAPKNEQQIQAIAARVPLERALAMLKKQSAAQLAKISEDGCKLELQNSILTKYLAP